MNDQIVRGLIELDQALGVLPDRVQIHVAAVAMAKAAEVIRTSASDRAPDRTGQLAADMTYEISAFRDELVAHIGPDEDSFYGVFVEFGTGPRRRESKTGTGFSGSAPAQPFLRPAIDEDGPAAVTVLANELAAGIEREARRLGDVSRKAA